MVSNPDSAELISRYEENCGLERENELQRPVSDLEHLLKDEK